MFNFLNNMEKITKSLALNMMVHNLILRDKWRKYEGFTKKSG